MPPKPRGLASIVSWPRVRFTAGIALLFGLLFSISSETPTLVWIVRVMIVAFGCMCVFGIFQLWPRKLPKRISRSVVQLLAILIAVPFCAGFAFSVTVSNEQRTSDERKKLMMGYLQLTFAGVLFAPWIAVGAMLKQRDAFAREQALAFELESSRLERSALDAKMRLLQAQVEPHFLFNTLANVQALVESGSPQASKVLESLIAYLRAAVPRIHEPSTTLMHELELVRAYLVVMRMRIPDRLEFSLRIDPAAREVACPPMTVLTLVENAVRHGIDPSETGGRIDVEVVLVGERCLVRVRDTGVGFNPDSRGLGTGLSTLRERLQLAFGADAQLRLIDVAPHGVCAELELPIKAPVT